ncbi:MAG: hypothetical protein LBR30_06825 [Clostridioides sp.]|jgi:hypothetical protein|nr:hypothetical protein [Clostridioides sp.]
MTFKDIIKLINKYNISASCLGSHEMGNDGFEIYKNNNGKYEVYYFERYEKSFLSICDTEKEACKAFVNLIKNYEPEFYKEAVKYF